MTEIGKLIQTFSARDCSHSHNLYLEMSWSQADRVERRDISNMFPGGKQKQATEDVMWQPASKGTCGSTSPST